MTEKRITWKDEGGNMILAFNNKNEELGNLKREKVGRYMHWCWYQEQTIRMSPGCLQEVRDKQKELFNKKRET